MKILYLITVRGHGSGGHFHSLNHISQAMAEKCEVKICTYGAGKSLVLEKNPFFKKHFPFKGYNFLGFRKGLKQVLADYRPDAVHCFDIAAYSTFTLFIGHNEYPIFLNKCGGPSPRYYYPLVQNLILFSEENNRWFIDQPKFKNSNIVVIPNRVNPRLLQFNHNKPFPKKDAFCFVRIARIGTAYKKSIEDSIRLIQKLYQDGLNVHLYIIGTIQDEEIARQTQNKIKNLPVTVITDPKYTAKASDMLYLADAVIATGRGAMEASFLAKPILTPAKNSKLPILVGQDNFKGFFDTNFSQRNSASDACLATNLSHIKKLVTDMEFYTKSSEFYKRSFEKHFSTLSGIELYYNFYKKNLNSNSLKLTFFTDLIFKLRIWYSFVK